MKLIIKLMCLITLILSFTAYADPSADISDPEGGDNHFSVMTPPACPETVQQALFEQQTWAAVLTPQKDKPGTYELKLQGVRGHLLYFSEQPFRMGRMNNIRFYNLWLAAAKEKPELSFKAYMEGTTKKDQNYIFQLSAPRYHGTTVSFQAKLVSEAEIKSRLNFNDVTLIIQVPECNSCTDFPCLSC
ncbi:MAG TPA: hypothetical protein VD770_05650 [Coxiellaceae bacterium]|nr:hypothetical protein [Coxiellaceae bacterium]